MFSKGIRPLNWTPTAYVETQNWVFIPISGNIKYSDNNNTVILKKNYLYVLPFKKLYSLTDVENTRFNHIYIAFNCSLPIRDFMEINLDKDAFLRNTIQFIRSNYKTIVTDDLAEPITSILLSHLFPKATNSDVLAYDIKSFVDSMIPHFDFDAVCRRFNYSKRYLDLRFKKVFNMSIFKYAKNEQFVYVADMLKQNHSLKEACDSINYSSIANLSRDFNKHFGMTPLEYKAFTTHNKRPKIRKPNFVNNDIYR